MTAKEYLEQIQILDRSIEQQRSDLNNLHDIATAIGSFDYSKDRVQTSPKGEAPYTRTAEKAIELDKKIEKRISMREHIIEQIYSLEDPRYVNVLIMRYVEYAKYEKFEDIADKLGYHWHYIYQLHDEALNAFEKKFVKNLKNILV